MRDALPQLQITVSQLIQRRGTIAELFPNASGGLANLQIYVKPARFVGECTSLSAKKRPFEETWEQVLQAEKMDKRDPVI